MYMTTSIHMAKGHPVTFRPNMPTLQSTDQLALTLNYPPCMNSDTLFEASPEVISESVIRDRWDWDGMGWFASPSAIALAVKRTGNPYGITKSGQPYIAPEVGMRVKFDGESLGRISEVLNVVDGDRDPEVRIEKDTGGFRYGCQTALFGYSVVNPATEIGPHAPSLYLEFESYGKWGNIRLKNRVTVTGVKEGERVAVSPGNGFKPVRCFGVVTGIAERIGGEFCVRIKTEDGDDREVGGDFLQRVGLGIAIGLGSVPAGPSRS